MTDIKRLDSSDPGFREALEQLLTREAEADRQVERAVQEIIAAVRERGDEAVLEFTERFDGWKPASAVALEVPASRCEQALAAIDRVGRDGVLDPAAAGCTKEGQALPVALGHPTVRIAALEIGSPETLSGMPAGPERW